MKTITNVICALKVIDNYLSLIDTRQYMHVKALQMLYLNC